MSDSPHSIDSNPENPPAGVDSAHRVNVEAERQRQRRWYWGLGVLALIGLFGLININYPVAEANGRTYRIISQGRYVGTEGSRTEMQYFTEHSSMDSVPAEAETLLPLVTPLADQHGDHIIRMSAVRHVFRYGLLAVSQSVHVDFAKDGNEWRRAP